MIYIFSLSLPALRKQKCSHALSIIIARFHRLQSSLLNVVKCYHQALEFYFLHFLRMKGLSRLLYQQHSGYRLPGALWTSEVYFIPKYILLRTFCAAALLVLLPCWDYSTRCLFPICLVEYIKCFLLSLLLSSRAFITTCPMDCTLRMLFISTAIVCSIVNNKE